MQFLSFGIQFKFVCGFALFIAIAHLAFLKAKKQALWSCSFDEGDFNAFHAAGECRRQVKNVTKYVEIVEFHDHI